MGRFSEMKQKFKNVKHFKPNSSRKESVEMYVIAQGYKPAENTEN